MLCATVLFFLELILLDFWCGNTNSCTLLNLQSLPVHQVRVVLAFRKGECCKPLPQPAPAGAPIFLPPSLLSAVEAALCRLCERVPFRMKTSSVIHVSH